MLPSYEECVTGTISIREEEDERPVEGSTLRWAPVYAVYKFIGNARRTTAVTSDNAAVNDVMLNFPATDVITTQP